MYYCECKEVVCFEFELDFVAEFMNFLGTYKPKRNTAFLFYALALKRQEWGKKETKKPHNERKHTKSSHRLIRVL